MAQNQHNRLSIIFNSCIERCFIRRNGLRGYFALGFSAYKYLFLSFVCLFSVFISPAVYCESIVLRSGKTVEGAIKKRTDKFILLDVGLDFPITYYLDEIESIQGGAGNVSVSPENEADRLEQNGLELIEQGRMEEGMQVLGKAIELSPSPNRHLNLGSILFGNGVSEFKQGRKKKALALFKQAQTQLSKAIEKFDEKTDGMFLSHAYFMMGEMSAQGFEDKENARILYKKSISFYPNPAAERGLNELDRQ